MKHIRTFALALVASVSLIACGGGGDGASQTAVVNTGTIIPVNLTTGSSVTQQLQGATFNYGSIPSLGLTQPVTLSLVAGSTGDTNFNLSSGGNTASGPMSYGSCIFNINRSTFPADHPLATGKSQRINPCNVVLQQALQADGLGKTVDVKFVIGDAVPTNTKAITIAVSPTTGAVTLVTPSGNVITLPITVPTAVLTGGTAFTGSVSVR